MLEVLSSLVAVLDSIVSNTHTKTTHHAYFMCAVDDLA